MIGQTQRGYAREDLLGPLKHARADDAKFDCGLVEQSIGLTKKALFQRFVHRLQPKESIWVKKQPRVRR